MPSVDLSVIIVNYNVRSFLEQTLYSVLRAGSNLRMEIMVVDNDSADGSADMVAETFPEVRLIRNTENVGFGTANNQAIREAHGRYLLILNPDTIVQEDTLDTLVRFMDEHEEAGAVGCQILNPDGSFAPESRRAFPSPTVAFYRISGLGRLFPKSRRFGRYNLTYLPIEEVAEVDALSGSCMMVRHAALYRSEPDARELSRSGEPPVGPELRSSADSGVLPDSRRLGTGAGLFDEDYFMYAEDLDWCFRIREAGWRIYYTPETRIIHFKGESTKRGELRYVKLFYGAMSQFVEKNLHGRQSRLLSILIHFGIFVKALQAALIQTLGRIRQPLAEWALSCLLIIAVAWIRSLPSTFSFSALFYYAVAPAYAFTILLGIATVGGYRRGNRSRILPVMQGIGIAFLIVTTASFFVKSIAFSRTVLLFGFFTSAVALAALRWILHEMRERAIGSKQAVLVGHADDAMRLNRRLRDHPRPPFELIGYIQLDGDMSSSPTMLDTVPRLGGLHHLRDIVRLRHIDDVVFSAPSVANESMFRIMQGLIDLPVDFKILPEGRERVIGKAFVEPLFVKAESEINLPRSRFARRIQDVPMGLLMWGIHHLLLFPISRLIRSRKARQLMRHTGQSLDVVRGNLALVGYHDDDEFVPPREWRIAKGAFPVVARALLSKDEIRDRYWKYAQEQSFITDMRILMSHITSDVS